MRNHRRKQSTIELTYTCYLMGNINKCLVHPAFSVFLFNPETKKLLLQHGVSERIPFSTNTCCSHRLRATPELGYDLSSGIAAIKRVAEWKLDHELGIKTAQVPTDEMRFLTPIRS